jgi:hypothetical protein
VSIVNKPFTKGLKTLSPGAAGRERSGEGDVDAGWIVEL